MKQKILFTLITCSIVFSGLQAQICYDDDNNIYFSTPESKQINPHNYMLLTLESYLMLTSIYSVSMSNNNYDNISELSMYHHKAFIEAFKRDFQPFCDKIRKEVKTVDLLIIKAVKAGFHSDSPDRRRLQKLVNDLANKVTPFICNILQKVGSNEALRLKQDIKLLQQDLPQNLKVAFESQRGFFGALLEKLEQKHLKPCHNIKQFGCSKEIQSKKEALDYELFIRNLALVQSLVALNFSCYA